DVEESFLLAGERGVRQVFSGSRGAHGNREVVVAGGHLGKGLADIGIQLGREIGLHDPLADLRAGLGQGVDIIHIQGVEGSMDTIVQTALLEEIPIGLCGSGKATRYGYTGTGEVADHLAQRGVLAPYSLNIVIAEL